MASRLAYERGTGALCVWGVRESGVKNVGWVNQESNAQLARFSDGVGRG